MVANHMVYFFSILRRFSPQVIKLLNQYMHDMVYVETTMRRFSPHIEQMVNRMKDSQHNLSSLVPFGLLASRPWLMSKGVQRHTIDNWVKSGQLVAVARGVFKRPEAEVTWQGVVYSLQRMGNLLKPGGLTALTLQGMAHYLSQNEQKNIFLYGHNKLPAWINKLLPKTFFVRHKELDFDSKNSNPDLGFYFVPWKTPFLPSGYDKQPMYISSPELAVLEVLFDVPEHVSFEHADQLLQGLPTLSPKRLTRLLECCSNVKVKRLFLWLAEKNQSPWLKKIDLKKFSMESGSLGSGKRMIVKGGRLDPKYLITVPKEMGANAYR